LDQGNGGGRGGDKRLNSRYVLEYI
jgi:hypothetical protein